MKRAKQSILAAAAALTLGLLGTPGARAQMVDRVAAVVNSDIIPLSEVQQRAAPELARLGREPDPAARTKARDQVTRAALDQVISEKLIDAELKDANVEVTEALVDANLEEVRKNNNLTPEQFQQAIREQGYTNETFREQFRRQLQRQQLIRVKVMPKVKVTDQDLRTEYARYTRDSGEDPEVHVRHVVVAVPADATPAQIATAEQKARNLATQARAPGVDFAAFAKKHSETSSAADGGDLGFFKRGTMEPAFDKVAFNLKVGEISDPVRTKFGFHILKLEERKNGSVKGFDEMKQELQAKLQQSKAEKATVQYLEQLRANANVEVKI